MRYKGLVFDCKDHPFGIGVCCIAASCCQKCPLCPNQHLIALPELTITPLKLTEIVQKRSINNCLVLGGLEWTEQIEDVYKLLKYNKKNNNKLKIILYTHHTEKELHNNYTDLFRYKLLIKCGKYYPYLQNKDYCSYGIHLASTNQYIFSTM
jgi:hypothetical protein